MLLDDFMPQYDFGEVHSTVVEAPPERVFCAIRDLTPRDILLFRTFFWIRSLPAQLIGKRASSFDAAQPLLQQFLNAGFVVLAESPNKEIVLGTIGQFWKLWGGSFTPIADGQDFLAFDTPGYAKATLNFYLDERPSNTSVSLRTETRIYVPDPATRRKFSLYWRLVHPGSALLRRTWLRAIKRRAERPSERV